MIASPVIYTYSLILTSLFYSKEPFLWVKIYLSFIDKFKLLSSVIYTYSLIFSSIFFIKEQFLYVKIFLFLADKFKQLSNIASSAIKFRDFVMSRSSIIIGWIFSIIFSGLNSHTLNVPSMLPVTIFELSGEKFTLVTLPIWPYIGTFILSPVLASQIIARLFSHPVTIHLLFGEKHRHQICD